MSSIMAEDDMQCFTDTSSSEESGPDNEEAGTPIETDLVSPWISQIERENIVQLKNATGGGLVCPKQVWDMLKDNRKDISQTIRYVIDKWHGWAVVSVKEMPFSQITKPNNVICDVYFINPKDPLVILTFTAGVSKKGDIIEYNCFLKVTIEKKVEKKVGETLHLARGVITETACKTMEEFERELQIIVTTAISKFPERSLAMGVNRYKKVTEVMLDMFSDVAAIPRQITDGSENETSTGNEPYDQRRLYQEAQGDEVTGEEKVPSTLQLKLTSHKSHEIKTNLATKLTIDRDCNLKRDCDERQKKIRSLKSMSEEDSANLKKQHSKQIPASFKEQSIWKNKLNEKIGINRQLEKPVMEFEQQAPAGKVSGSEQLEAVKVQEHPSSHALTDDYKAFNSDQSERNTNENQPTENVAKLGPKKDHQWNIKDDMFLRGTPISSMTDDDKVQNVGDSREDESMRNEKPEIGSKWGPQKDQQWSEKEIKNVRDELLVKYRMQTKNNLKILLFGPTGQGKSSLGNSLMSALERDEHVSNTFSVGTAVSGGSVTTVFNPVKILGDSWLIDMPGIFETKAITDARIEDIASGKVPFYTELSKHLKVNGIHADPPPGKNDVACVVIVLNYDLEFGDEIRRQLDVIKRLAGKGVISYQLVLTHLDVCDRQFKDNDRLPNIYESELVQKAVERMADEAGVPPYCISFVKNYVRETEKHPFTTLLHLRVMKKIVSAACDQTRKRQDMASMKEHYDDSYLYKYRVPIAVGLVLLAVLIMFMVSFGKS